MISSGELDGPRYCHFLKLERSSLSTLKPRSCEDDSSRSSLPSSSAPSFRITRRMRSLPISAMVLYPALNASLSGEQGSGSWTRMNFRLPLSCLFSSSTAWAVAAEPAKKSRMMSLFLEPWLTNAFKSDAGFGKSNILPSNRSRSSRLPLSVNPTFALRTEENPVN